MSLLKAVSEQEESLMSSSNLAIIMAPNLLHSNTDDQLVFASGNALVAQTSEWAAIEIEFPFSLIIQQINVEMYRVEYLGGDSKVHVLCMTIIFYVHTLQLLFRS